jgi:nicotinamidase/pyrazinamidase
LVERGIRRLFVAGLATDYCVRQSALDARRHGLEVTLIEDAARGVEVRPGDTDAAVRDMTAAGVSVASSVSLLAPGRD